MPPMCDVLARLKTSQQRVYSQSTPAILLQLVGIADLDAIRSTNLRLGIGQLAGSASPIELVEGLLGAAKRHEHQ